MLIHPTVERLRALGLTAMADAFLELHTAPDAGEPAARIGSGCSSIATRMVSAFPNGYVIELTARTGKHGEIMDPAISKPHEALAHWQATKSH